MLLFPKWIWSFCRLLILNTHIFVAYWGEGICSALFLHLCTTSFHFFFKECGNRGHLSKLLSSLVFSKLVFYPVKSLIQLSGNIWYLSTALFTIGQFLENYTGFLKHCQTFCPHSQHQTLRKFEGYPCIFSNQDTALVLENSWNSRARMKILQTGALIYHPNIDVWFEISKKDLEVG